ncbi:30S ribosomal protein S20, chloroplastic [Carica papaya]|uniref:30S ribosomal protein S20, chloroplastic n=1 Tax=Carica papaya TaxID=3649 RepID=UPI000B8C8C37|nr:30S ribosomal protein S20, chloroplastic [Carica papaya]
MASAVHCLSSCLTLNSKLRSLSLKCSSSSSSSTSSLPGFNSCRSLSFSTSISNNVFSKGSLSMSRIRRPTGHSVVCEAAPKKKADSAAKRARQAEKRRIYNKAHKSEIRTRMKKVTTFLKKQN